jgi:hypothetical protein
MAAKILNYKWILLSLLLGSATSWQIKEELTPLLLGRKNFDARSELVQIGILILLTVLISLIILCLMAILEKLFLQKFKAIFQKAKIYALDKKGWVYLGALIFIIVLVEILIFNRRFVISHVLGFEERHYSINDGGLHQFNLENGKLVAQNNDPNITIEHIEIPIYYISINCSNSVPGAAGQVYYFNHTSNGFNETQSIHYDASSPNQTLRLLQTQPVSSLRLDLTNTPGDVVTCREFVLNPLIPFQLSQGRLVIYAELVLLLALYIFLVEKKFGSKRVVQFFYYISLLCFNIAACIFINNQMNSSKISLLWGILMGITIGLLYLGDRYIFEIEASANKGHLIKDAILISLTIWIVYIWSYKSDIIFSFLPIATLLGRRFLHISWKRIVYSLLVVQVFTAALGLLRPGSVLEFVFFRNKPGGDFFHFSFVNSIEVQTEWPSAEDPYTPSNVIWIAHPEYFQNQTIQTNEELCTNNDFCKYAFRSAYRQSRLVYDETRDYSISREERSKYLAKDGFYVPTTKGGWYLITENWSSDGVIEYYYYANDNVVELFFVPTIKAGNTTYPSNDGFITSNADVIFALLLTSLGLLLAWFFKDKVPFAVFGLSSFLWGGAVWIIVVLACFAFNTPIKLWALPIFIIINAGLGIWIAARKITLSKGEIKILAISILINCALAFVCQYFNPVFFTMDSFVYYEKIPQYLVNGQLGEIIESLRTVGFSINALQSGAPLLGKYYLPSIIPILFVNLIVFANLAVSASFKQKPAGKRYLLPVILINLSFILLPMVVLHNFYLHANLVTGIYLCAAVICFTLYCNDTFDLVAPAVFGGLSFFAFMVSRIENGLFGVVIGLLILLKTRYGSKKISAIFILTSVLMIAYVIKLLAYKEIAGHRLESSLILFAHTILIMFNLIVFIWGKTFPLLDKILDNFPRIFFITAFILVGLYLVIIDFERVVTNLQTFILSRFLQQSMGMFWALGIACVVILIFIQDDKLKWANWFITVFCVEELLYLLLFTEMRAYTTTAILGSPTRSVLHYMFLLLPYLLINYLALLRNHVSGEIESTRN